MLQLALDAFQANPAIQMRTILHAALKWNRSVPPALAFHPKRSDYRIGVNLRHHF